MQKRSFNDDDDDVEDIDTNAIKKFRSDDIKNNELMVIPTNNASNSFKSSLELMNIGRTSSLQAPEIQLIGHENAVYSIAFDPSGENLCSGSLDRQICKNCDYI